MFKKFFTKTPEPKPFIISNLDKFTVKSEPTITREGIIQIGGLEAPYKTIYDLTNVPGKWHYLFINAMVRG